MIKKIRADDLLVQKKLAPNKSSASRLIMAGLVYEGTRKVEKSGTTFLPETILSVKEKLHPWVSRGGMKLSHAVEHFSINVKNVIALDIGASTGGFCDVLLYHGAKKVFAVDVGYGQLADKIRHHPNIVTIERKNARYLTHDDITEKPNFLTCDASFISLQKILPAPLSLLAQDAAIVVLIKPQFQLDRSYIGKNGVVRDAKYQQKAIDDVLIWLHEQHCWNIHEVIESPITGPKGNKEFLLYAVKNIMSKGNNE